jgi:6-pyruvoyltetrahydropterin/6-carboxytetrahydropterin synthase
MNYSGKCRHPHGHNGRVEVEISAAHLDRLGMVMDFDDIKKNIQTWIDENFDHKMILRKDDPLVEVLKKLDEPVYLFEDNPTAENIARVIFGIVKGKGIPITRVTVWETEKSSAVYFE